MEACSHSAWTRVPSIVSSRLTCRCLWASRERAIRCTILTLRGGVARMGLWLVRLPLVALRLLLIAMVPLLLRLPVLALLLVLPIRPLLRLMPWLRLLLLVTVESLRWRRTGSMPLLARW